MLAMDPRWLYLDLRLLSSGQRRASASVGALSFVTLPASYSVQRDGCAICRPPDGQWSAVQSPSFRDDRSPGATPCRGLFLVRFGRPSSRPGLLPLMNSTRVLVTRQDHLAVDRPLTGQPLDPLRKLHSGL